VTAARSRHVATLLLVGLTAIWGSTFFLIRNVVLQMSPADFLAVRFTIAAVAVLAVFWRQLLALTKREIQVGVGLGVVYAVAQFMQTVGLEHTEATRSGFITGTYVVLTPILTAVLLREPIPRSTWFAVLMATAGLVTLSLNGFGFGFGESVTLFAAVLYALHIIGLGRYSSAASAAGLSAVQLIVIAVVSLMAASPGGIELPNSAGAWASVLYMALMAGAVAIWAQTCLLMPPCVYSGAHEPNVDPAGRALRPRIPGQTRRALGVRAAGRVRNGLQGQRLDPHGDLLRQRHQREPVHHQDAPRMGEARGRPRRGQVRRAGSVGALSWIP